MTDTIEQRYKDAKKLAVSYFKKGDEYLVQYAALGGHCQNIYIGLDGTIRPHKFPTSGLWTFDGQFYIPPRNPTIKGIN